jgi:hypothetical protein
MHATFMKIIGERLNIAAILNSAQRAAKVSNAIEHDKFKNRVHQQ